MFEVVISLEIDSKSEVDHLLTEITEHQQRDATDGHRDSGVLMIGTKSIVSVGMRECA